MNCEQEYTSIIFKAMFEMSENNPTQAMYAEKTAALMSLLKKCKYFQKQGFLLELIIEICRKKAEFIKKAATKNELQTIMKLPGVRYNGNEVLPANKYCIPEEELIAWSITSLYSPLISAGQKRYEKLFKQVFPDKTDIFNH